MAEDASAAELEWRGEAPVSARYGDPYWSLEDGLAEARHVHLAAGRLAERMAGRAAFQVCELGFGAGLNLLAVLGAARAAGCALRFWSVEAHPMGAAAMARALAVWPELEGTALARAWAAAGEGLRGDAAFSLPGAEVVVAVGTAGARAAEAPMADAWLLDGFAPAKNPQMWGQEVLGAVGRATLPGGSATTYAAAGAVRRGLAAAGFEVQRLAGYGRKRDMTAGWKR
ncbi:MAG: tRNA (5-methylaminomethyl-2-thiouridine)(34)-methyltransferase MnmD [Pseudomonadota bacterium]